MKKLNSNSYSNKMPISERSCCICLSEYRNPIITRCGHKFCRACLDRWIDELLDESKDTAIKPCPICRADISDLINIRNDFRPERNPIQPLVRPPWIISPANPPLPQPADLSAYRHRYIVNTNPDYIMRKMEHDRILHDEFRAVLQNFNFIKTLRKP
jgi:hypothetical protein